MSGALRDTAGSLVTFTKTEFLVGINDLMLSELIRTLESKV